MNLEKELRPGFGSYAPTLCNAIRKELEAGFPVDLRGNFIAQEWFRLNTVHRPLGHTAGEILGNAGADEAQRLLGTDRTSEAAEVLAQTGLVTEVDFVARDLDRAARLAVAIWRETGRRGEIGYITDGGKNLLAGRVVILGASASDRRMVIDVGAFLHPHEPDHLNPRLTSLGCSDIFASRLAPIKLIDDGSLSCWLDPLPDMPMFSGQVLPGNAAAAWAALHTCVLGGNLGVGCNMVERKTAGQAVRDVVCNNSNAALDRLLLLSEILCRYCPIYQCGKCNFPV